MKLAPRMVMGFFLTLVSACTADAVDDAAAANGALTEKPGGLTEFFHGRRIRLTTTIEIQVCRGDGTIGHPSPYSPSAVGAACSLILEADEDDRRVRAGNEYVISQATKSDYVITAGPRKGRTRYQVEFRLTYGGTTTRS